MHKPLSHAEVEALNTASPVVTMTRVEKLERWATLLERYKFGIVMAHNLEFLSQNMRDAASWGASPMGVAAADSVFQDAGLKGETIKDVKDFFEISDEDVHAFSCNCGGVQTGAQMAGRIRAIARGHSNLSGLKRALFG